MNAITTTITPSIRFRAQDLRRDCMNSGGVEISAVIYSAAQAEAFPHSYTDEAVALSVSVLLLAASGEVDCVARVGQQMDVMKAEGRWYA